MIIVPCFLCKRQDLFKSNNNSLKTMTKFNKFNICGSILVSSDFFIDRKLILGSKTICQGMRECPFAVSLKKSLKCGNFSSYGHHFFLKITHRNLKSFQIITYLFMIPGNFKKVVKYCQNFLRREIVGLCYVLNIC